MTITLTLSPLPDGDTKLSGFIQFWLKYVHGFSPHFHCYKSLRGTNDPRFSRTMPIGTSFDLVAPIKYRHIYLCGVTSKKYPGLHFALVPEEGAYAETQSYNGMKVTATNARQIAITPLEDGFAGMSHKYTSCCNWQFGVAEYGLENMRRELVRD